jgi:RNase adapter protein RapZ
MGEYVVITGQSGGGRTEASRTFEDLGWFIIDNLPASLIPKVAELAGAPGSSIEKVALAIAPGRSDDEELLPAISALRSTGDRVRVVFLDTSTERLVQRYESARRRHPFAAAGGGISDAIEAERLALEGLKGEADIVIDTSDLNVHELRSRIGELFADESPSHLLRTRVMSFGYKHGLPRDVDIVLDCRFLPNPHWIPELRPKSGLDGEVVDYVLQQPVARPFLFELERTLALLIPAYVREGKSFLSIALGCTGGRHRSVVMAEQAAAILRRHGLEPTVDHRDIDR